jgi:hypothetical protein
MRRTGVFFLLLALSCGTQAPPAGGDKNLPNAGVGPFRVLKPDEMPSTAPFALSPQKPGWRSPAVLDIDGDPGTMGIFLYVASVGEVRFIFGFEVEDGRFGTDRTQSLAKDQDWEDASGVDDPAVLRVDGSIWMFYASGACIGKAVSEDGVAFQKTAGPVLCTGPSQGSPAWEGERLSGPAVYRARDGSFRLFYASGGKIGEARSLDGDTFERVGSEPALTPAPPAGPLVEDAGVDEPFDDDAVGDPDILTGELTSGRPVTYVYYTGTNRLGMHAVGLAARFGDDGPLTRNPTPVLTRFGANAPSVVRRSGFLLLYSGGKSSDTNPVNNPAVIAAIAPATLSIPLPADEAKDAGADGGQKD